MGPNVRIDTLKFARSLKEAGAEDRLAEAIAEGIASADMSELATKTDIAELRADVAETRAAMKTEIAELRETSKTEIAGLRADNDRLDAKIDSSAAELRTEIAESRADMKAEFATLYRHLWIMGGSIVALIVAIDRLFP